MSRYHCLKCGAEHTPISTPQPALAGLYLVKCVCNKKPQMHRLVDGSGQPQSLADDTGQARATDPATSQKAASRVRTGSARAALLKAHASNAEYGMTDEQAAAWAGLPLTSEYATRCSELERQGLLENTTEERAGTSGMSRMVRRITKEGKAVAAGLS